MPSDRDQDDLPFTAPQHDFGAAGWRPCHDPDCDGPAGHDGPHFQWIPE